MASAEKPKVLLIGNFLYESIGTRSISEELMDQLIKRKWDVLYTTKYKQRLLKLINMCFTIYSNRRSFDIACVEIYSGNAFIWGRIVSCLLVFFNKSFVLALHGGNLPNYSLKFYRKVKNTLQKADCVVTPSLHLQNQLSSLRSDIQYIPNGLLIKNYKFKERINVSPSIIWLRAFHKVYNPTLALKALQILVGEFPEIELTMFGPDKGDGSHQEVQHFAQSAGLVPHLHMPGAVPKEDVPTVLNNYDIFLNTTTAESFGVSVMEAAAVGMCIVTTDVGELPYLWTHEQDALLVPSDDPTAMAAAVRRILTEPGLASRLSRNARRKAEQFDWAIILPQWETLFQEIFCSD